MLMAGHGIEEKGSRSAKSLVSVNADEGTVPISGEGIIKKLGVSHASPNGTPAQRSHQAYVLHITKSRGPMAEERFAASHGSK
jgi:hypothetical protein